MLYQWKTSLVIIVCFALLIQSYTASASKIGKTEKALMQNGNDFLAMWRCQEIANAAYKFDESEQYDAAIEGYYETLACYKKENSLKGQAVILDSIAKIYVKKSDIKSAIEIYSQELAIWEMVGDQQWESHISYVIGIGYQVQLELDMALIYLQRALNIDKESRDQYGIIADLSEIALVHKFQRNYDTAKQYLTEALEIAKLLGDYEQQINLLTSLADIYTAQGQTRESWLILEQALTIADQTSDQQQRAFILNYLAPYYYAFDKPDMGMSAYKEALDIYHRIGSQENESLILQNIGTRLLKQNNNDEARVYYKKALDLALELRNTYRQTQILTGIGETYAQQQHYEEAFNYYTQALDLAHEIEALTSERDILHKLGNLYAAQEDYDTSLSHYQRAYNITTKASTWSDEFFILWDMSMSYWKKGNLEDATSTLTKALDLVEGTRSHMYNEYDRMYLGSSTISVYDSLIELYLLQNDIISAFEITERGRARAFLDSINTNHIDVNNDTSAKLLAKEQEAFDKVNIIKDRLDTLLKANPNDFDLVDALKHQLTKYQVEYNDVLGAINTHDQRLTELLPARNHVLNLKEIQRFLDEETTLVSYWLLKDRLVVFLVTKLDSYPVVVEVKDVNLIKINGILNSIYAPNEKWLDKEQPHPFYLRNLYDLLIAPLTPHITTKTKRIAIIPHLVIHYVPFASLVDQVALDKNYINEEDRKEYFGEKYTFYVLPAASALRVITKNEIEAQSSKFSKSLIFGNPEVENTDIKPLYYAESEALAIGRQLNVKAYLGADATEKKLRQNIVNSGIVHIAAHGLYDKQNPLDSTVILAKDTDYDGLLATREIYGLPLKGNRLTVLSACETGLGSLNYADELTGLTRAFLFAGSPTVISSLWTVDDASTEALMTAFYHYWLDEGMTKAEALQAAQADVRSDSRWISPYYWAGFVLNGHPGNH